MKDQKGNSGSDKEAEGTIQPKVFTLCGVQGCCPTVTIDQSVVITDDNGGKVTLTLDEFTELQNINKA